MNRFAQEGLAAVAVVAALSIAASAQDAKVDPGELKKLQGSWVLASGEVDGKPVAPDAVAKSRMTYSGETIELMTPHQSKDPIVARVTRLDPTKTPHRMDWVRAAGPGKGKTMMAAYAFDGDDQYKVCFDPDGKARPATVASKQPGCRILHVWKRAKP